MSSGTGVVLGVDLATADARVVALDEEGHVLARRHAALPPVVGGTTPSGEAVAEQQPSYLPVVLDLLRAVADDLADGADRAGDVVALSLTGTSGSLVPCDRSGRPLGPALLYSDGQAVTQAEALRAAGVEATPTSPMARAGLLVALGAERVLHTPDVVLAGLVGEVVPTDTSHALKAGIDPVARTWDPRALAALHVPEAALPGLVHPGTVLGHLGAAATAATGLPAQVQVVAGMTDGCTAQVAAGAVAPGDSVGVLGTTLVLKAVSAHEVRGVGGALYSHYAPDGAWWAGGASNVGAGPVRDELGGTSPRALADLEREARRLGPASAVAYPLRGTGERFPVARPDARGFVLGGPVEGVRAYRAFLEGVAYVERIALDVLREHGVEPTLHHLGGGGSRNLLWSQLRATVLEVPCVRAGRASSAHGAALLALAGATGEPLVDVVARTAPTDPADLVEPLEDEREQLLDGLHRLREELDRRGLLDPVVPVDAATAPRPT